MSDVEHKYYELLTKKRKVSAKKFGEFFTKLAKNPTPKAKRLASQMWADAGSFFSHSYASLAKNTPHRVREKLKLPVDEVAPKKSKHGYSPKAGDVVLLKRDGGAVVHISKIYEDVKDGEPGYDGVLLKVGTMGGEVGRETWGYNSQISRKLTSDEVKKLRKRTALDDSYRGMHRSQCRTLEQAKERVRCEKLAESSRIKHFTRKVKGFFGR